MLSGNAPGRVLYACVSAGLQYVRPTHSPPLAGARQPAAVPHGAHPPVPDGVDRQRARQPGPSGGAGQPRRLRRGRVACAGRCRAGAAHARRRRAGRTTPNRHPVAGPTPAAVPGQVRVGTGSEPASQVHALAQTCKQQHAVTKCCHHANLHVDCDSSTASQVHPPPRSLLRPTGCCCAARAWWRWTRAPQTWTQQVTPPYRRRSPSCGNLALLVMPAAA